MPLENQMEKDFARQVLLETFLYGQRLWMSLPATVKEISILFLMQRCDGMVRSIMFRKYLCLENKLLYCKDNICVVTAEETYPIYRHTDTVRTKPTWVVFTDIRITHHVTMLSRLFANLRWRGEHVSSPRSYLSEDSFLAL